MMFSIRRLSDCVAISRPAPSQNAVGVQRIAAILPLTRHRDKLSQAAFGTRIGDDAEPLSSASEA